MDFLENEGELRHVFQRRQFSYVVRVVGSQFCWENEVQGLSLRGRRPVCLMEAQKYSVARTQVSFLPQVWKKMGSRFWRVLGSKLQN